MKFVYKAFIFNFLFSLNVIAQFSPGYTNTYWNNHWSNHDRESADYTPQYYIEHGGSSNVYNFRVVMLNDSVIYTRSEIDFSGTVHFLKAKDGKRKLWIKPYETKEISRELSKGRRIRGIPTDSCWLFKTDHGRISFYSFLADPETDCIIAIQKSDDGAILPLTKDNVIAMVRDHEKSLSLAEKGKLFSSINHYNRK